jgi:hypothetical protein
MPLAYGGTFCHGGGKKDFIKMVVRETVCLLFGDLLIHHCVVPLPRWGRLHAPIRTLCSKVFAPLFSKSGRGLGRRPKCRHFLFGAFSFVPSWFKRKSG